MSKCLQPGDMAGSSHHRESAIACGRRRAAAPLGKRTKDEGRRTKDEGRGTKEEGRRTNGRAEHSQLARGQDARAPRDHRPRAGCPRSQGATARGQDARAPRDHRPRAGCLRSQGPPALWLLPRSATAGTPSPPSQYPADGSWSRPYQEARLRRAVTNGRG